MRRVLPGCVPHRSGPAAVVLGDLHGRRPRCRPYPPNPRPGNGLVAEAGANLRELMERMGHSTSRAALIYLHSTSERQQTLADAVVARVQSELDKTADDA